MEIAPTIAITTNDINVQNPSPSEPESEAPTRIQQSKTVPFTNGNVLKRPLHYHPAVVVTYRECLKNHAAGIGGHALDGCGEFMPSPSSNPSDLTSLMCAACGCHRNFHRRNLNDSSVMAVQPPVAAIAFQPRHHPPPPPPPLRSNFSSDDSASPPPISTPYMLLALTGSKTTGTNLNNVPGTHKRFRTKLSQYQKKRMLELAERVVWKTQKTEDARVSEFCRQIGVDKGDFKVWMHNNKNIQRSVDGDGRGDACNRDEHNDHKTVAQINLGGGANGLSSS